MAYKTLPADLPKRLRAAGFRVVEVEEWEDRGRPASTGGFAPVGCLCHHTATSRSVSVQAVLALLVRGRSDLPGPLCQVGIGRDGTIYLVAAGRANHAGDAKASGSVAAGDGNTLYIGIEAFNDGVGEPWPAAQYDAYAKLCAWLSLNVTGSSVRTVRGHKETSVTGKIDPTFDMDRFRTRVAAEMDNFAKPVKPPKAPEPPKPVATTQLRIWHVSMQFSDTDEQMEADAARIFTAARKGGVAWVTGTEAGGGSPLSEILRKHAKDNGYRYWRAQGQDSWFAVDTDLIVGGWETWYSGTIVDGIAKRYTNKGVPSVSFDTKDLGRITVLACHYLTKGRPDAKNPEYRVHVEENRALALAIGQRAKVAGAGPALAFYGGDQNIVDRDADTFFGQPLTSVWDELEIYPGTGHGNIDVIASYNQDGRVSAVSSRVFTDRAFFLNTDHFLIEAVYEVRHLPSNQGR